MDETILFPSPNWFQHTCMAVSSDRWIIYGGPNKSLCVLEPLPENYDTVIKDKSYKAHVASRVGTQKVVSVDISPEWPSKRAVLTGNADGVVKQWNISYDENNILKIKTTHVHDIHKNENEEVAGVGYSNEVYAITVGCYGNIVKWDVYANVVKTYHNFLKNFKPTCMSCSKHSLLNVAVGTKQGVVFLLNLEGAGKIVYKVRAHDDDILHLSWCPQFEVIVKKELQKISAVSKRLQIAEEYEFEVIEKQNDTQVSQEDSAVEVEVEEDDMFDIYKDHETDEFGHKKFEPQDVYVKVHQKEEPNDFLSDCQKLKEDILKIKNKPEPSIESLVDALDKTHVNNKSNEEDQASSIENKSDNKKNTDGESISSSHIHRHLLATIGRNGNVRIWSKSGKQVSGCQVGTQSKNQRSSSASWLTLLWYKPDILLIADSKSNLLCSNPLNIDSKNKLTWHQVHSLHKRNIFSIVSTAPRVQTADTKVEDWPIYTVAQDRAVVEYSLKEKKPLRVHASCGGYVYTIASCPYDQRKIAASVGDGAVRVWEADTEASDEHHLGGSRVSVYWQNVMGKVLTLAWHPTRENLLAFATAESRVGTIDTSGGKFEKPAKTLPSVLGGGIYSICWGEDNNLYACGGGELVIYHTDKPDASPTKIKVELEGVGWKLSEVWWSSRALLVGSLQGAVAALERDGSHAVLAAHFPFTKVIHCIDWHPQEVSESDTESPLKNLIAVCSNDKVSHIAILEYIEKEDGSVKLSTWKTLTGHKSPVLRVAWNPHKEGLLLSTSMDCTVRVWDVQADTCTAIFGGHGHSTLGVSWSGQPTLPGVVMSGGADCCLRLWKMEDYPPEKYSEKNHESVVSKTKKKGKDKKTTSANVATLQNDSTDVAKKNEQSFKKNDDSDEEVLAANFSALDIKNRASKKFLLSFTNKEMKYHAVAACRKMLEKHTTESKEVFKDSGKSTSEDEIKFLRIFGSVKEINEFLEEELNRHDSSENNEAWIMLSLFRGNIDKVLEYANQRDAICPYLLSITPCVSFKLWKDATQLYLSQMDRLIARGEEDKLNGNKSYGGPVFRKTATQLSVHEIKGAVATLVEERLFKEAYVLCRVRFLDTIAKDVLQKWAEFIRLSGLASVAALLYIVVGDLATASSVLGRSNDEEHLSLAAEIAKISGQTTFAEHISEKQEMVKRNKECSANGKDILEPLPSRLECIMNTQSDANIVPSGGAKENGHVVE